MADEFKHKDAGEQLAYAEYHATDAHEADGQTENDVLFFDGEKWIRKPYTEILQLLLDSANQLMVTNVSGTLFALTVDQNNLIGRQTNNIDSLTPAEVMAILSGNAGANFSMNSKKITSLADPTDAQDADTKTARDTAIAAAVATHTADEDAHHTPFTDEQAIIWAIVFGG